MIDHKTREKWTAAIVADPRPGDRLQEIYSFWVHVEAREGDKLWISKHCGKWNEEEVLSLGEFKAYCEYDSVSGKYWLDAADRPRCWEA